MDSRHHVARYIVSAVCDDCTSSMTSSNIQAGSNNATKHTFTKGPILFVLFAVLAALICFLVCCSRNQIRRRRKVAEVNQRLKEFKGEHEVEPRAGMELKRTGLDWGIRYTDDLV